MNSNKLLDLSQYLLAETIDKYYSSIEMVKGGNGYMREVVEKIFNEYISAKEEPFGGHPLGIYFRNDIPKHIYGTGLVDSKDYLVTVMWYEIKKIIAGRSRTPWNRARCYQLFGKINSYHGMEKYKE